MKKITLSLIALLGIGTALPAQANDLTVATTMQTCASDADCALVTNSCQDNCGFVPVNKANLPALESQYQQHCGKPMSDNPTCNMNPPMSAACVNARCTIDYAYKNNSSAGDYKSGAYGVPEAPAPDKVPSEPYKDVNDRSGNFTAYDLPQDKVREGTVGTIYDRIYVPPSAPVSGGNYVPVGNAAAPAPMAVPAAPAPAPAAIPPAAMPTQQTHSTPAVAVPAPAPAAPATPMAPPPSQMPSAAPVPMSDVPAMTPSLPNQQVPTPPPSVPTTYVAPDPQPTGPVVPSIGATGVPVAPPGSKPIPPSDLKPVESSVPPPGGTIPVNPEDPGAPPPEGSTIMMKDGQLGVTTTTDGKVTVKDFSSSPPSAQKADKLGSYN